jgi:hypothetical protein
LRRLFAAAGGAGRPTPAREIPGIRLTLQPGFDVTPETGTDADADADGIGIGVVLDGNRHPASALSITSKSLNRHAFVTGATGSGKSQSVRHLLESAAKKGIPCLVIEPAKAGYGAEVRDNIRGFVAIRIGSLRTGTTGRFLDGGFPLDYARLLDGNVVLEIEDCGGDTDRAFLAGAVLIRLTEHLRMRARARYQDRPPPSGAGRPGRGRRHHEPHAGAVEVPSDAGSRRGRGVRRQHGLPDPRAAPRRYRT